MPGATIDTWALHIQGVALELVHRAEVRPTVFSLFLANALRTVEGDRTVCDLGTGCGLLAIVLARMGAERVIAIDHSELACELAAENARRNGVSDRVEVVVGEMAELKASSFDLLVSNPPTMPGLGAPGFASGGIDNLDTVRAIAHGLDAWMAPGGRLQIALSSLVASEALDLFQARGFRAVPGTDLLVPFRPFYYDCYEDHELEELVVAGRVVAEEDPRALSEVVTVYTVERGEGGSQMPSLGS
jgi:methylase of polypeptide subunit release factors